MTSHACALLLATSDADQYNNARGEYFTKQNINPHPASDTDDVFLFGVATVWLTLEDFTGLEEVADWVIWSVGFAEAYADIWGPPLAVVKGGHGVSAGNKLS